MSLISNSPAITSRRKRPPHPSPRCRTKNKSKLVKILKRCSSAPVLISPVDHEDEDVDDLAAQYGFKSFVGGTLFRPHTFSNAFESSDSLLGSSSVFASSPNVYSSEMKGYNKEAKVVVNVTVEGSTGPVRTMVKLGSTVEDIVKLVVDKYKEEGRSPKIDSNVPSSFQLHHSYFSLQGLDKSEVIGDLNRRSFYLRKRNGELCSENNDNLTKRSSANPPMLLPSFVVQKIDKIVRRIHRLWKFVICSP